MMVRWNKYGRFLGCAGFPECKNTKSLPSEEAKGEKCDQCQSPMVIKSGRLGRFLACTRYPDCRGTRSLPRGNKRLEIPKDWKEDCEKCGKPFRIRYGRRGGFIACSGYPDCKYIKKVEKKTGVGCPQCKEGELIVKRTRKGKTFYGCNRYPECDFAVWSPPVPEPCPSCGSLMVKQKGGTKCTNCDTVVSTEEPEAAQQG
jgi:DNA topoisomerase-1